MRMHTVTITTDTPPDSRSGSAAAATRRWWLHGRLATMALGISMLALLVTACGTTGTTTSPGANETATVSPSGTTVEIYFSKHPDSDTAPTQLFPVVRTSPTLGVATYAMGQLLAGPTAAEQAQGYYTPLQGALTGASTCNGADFTITLNSNRGHTETGTATLQFCRDVRGFGDTGAAIVRNEISKTLTQFPTIQKVVIIYKNGGCFDDPIGCD